MKQYDFGDGRGLVSAYQHVNGGGWVETGAQVAPGAFVGPDVVVSGTDTVIEGGAILVERVVVTGGKIGAQARLTGESRVEGGVVEGVVSGRSCIKDGVVLGQVSGNVVIAHPDLSVRPEGLLVGDIVVAGEVLSAPFVTQRITSQERFDALHRADSKGAADNVSSLSAQAPEAV